MSALPAYALTFACDADSVYRGSKRGRHFLTPLQAIPAVAASLQVSDSRAFVPPPPRCGINDVMPMPRLTWTPAYNVP